jgi:hypothetical protein
VRFFLASPTFTQALPPLALLLSHVAAFIPPLCELGRSVSQCLTRSSHAAHILLELCESFLVFWAQCAPGFKLFEFVDLSLEAFWVALGELLVALRLDLFFVFG